MKCIIREMKKEDWSQVAEIYDQGIKSGNATFETIVPEWEEWDNHHLKECRFVVITEEQIIGWAALNPVSSRPAYSGVAEVSIYVEAAKRGKGTGEILLNKLIEESERLTLWTLQAGIFPENEISINLFKKCGFKEVGIREKIGKLDGSWRDVVLLERRSYKFY
jgi:phosphinothricin acetyltransferase